jgi:hypothetical protein
MRDERLAAVIAPAAMTSEQDSQKHETPAPRHRSEGAGSQVMDLSSSVSEMDARRTRIHCQSRAATERITSDAEAQALLDDWTAPEPLGN